MVLDLAVAIQVATLLAYIAGAILFVVMIRADIRILRHDMNQLKSRQDTLTEAFNDHATTLRQIAVQDNRLDRLEQDIADIKRGEGFIFPMPRPREPAGS